MAKMRIIPWDYILCLECIVIRNTKRYSKNSVRTYGRLFRRLFQIQVLV